MTRRPNQWRQALVKMTEKIPPTLALFLIAPVFGELFSGSAPLNEFINPLTLITLALLYGCGAILCRELVIRWGKGWASLFLLGLAYGICEEGLMVQSFFDPAWRDLGSLAIYGRAAGVNWVWAEHLTLFHALISIAASVALVEILYPEQRQRSWVMTRRWWWGNWIGFAGIYLVWEFSTAYDPGIWKWLSWLAVLSLTLAARLIPGPRPSPVERKPARPRRFWWTGFLGMLGHFFIVYHGADAGAYPYPVAMSLLAIYYLAVLWLVLRWSGNGRVWDDRHRLALITGALCFFLILGPITVGKQYPVMYYTHPIYLLCLWLTYRSVNRRLKGYDLRFPWTC